MLAAWADVRGAADAAAGAAFLVVGEAGIGKSRLVAEVLDRVEASGGRVLGVGCLPVLRQRLAVADGPAARARARRRRPRRRPARGAGRPPHVARAGPGALGALPRPARRGARDARVPRPGTRPEPPSSTRPSTGSWSGCPRSRGAAPHLLVVEDLHWADPSTLGFLGRLADRQPAGLLTVATTRDAAAVPWARAVDVLELGRLDGASATRLIDNLAAGQELDGDRRASVVRQAEGIPLFIEELTRSYLDDTRTDSIPLRLQELFTSRLKAPGDRPAGRPGGRHRGADLRRPHGVGGDRGRGRRRRTAPRAGRRGGRRTDRPRGGHLPLPARADARRRLRDPGPRRPAADARRRRRDASPARAPSPRSSPSTWTWPARPSGPPRSTSSPAQAEQGRGAHLEATRLLSRAVELLERLPESDERDLSELTARMLRAFSVSSMRGYAAPEVQSDHRRAEVLATRLGRAGGAAVADRELGRLAGAAASWPPRTG